MEKIKEIYIPQKDSKLDSEALYMYQKGDTCIKVSQRYGTVRLYNYRYGYFIITEEELNKDFVRVEIEGHKE